MDQYKNSKNNKIIEKKQNAGSIIFNPFINENKLLKRKMTNGIIKYFNINDYSNIFNKNEYNDIIIFINFILPYCLPYDDKLDIVNNIETMGAGSFGVTMAYKNHVIKIIKINDKNSINNATNEINNSLILFYDENGNENNNIPDEINRIYFYITSNKKVHDNIYIKNVMTDEYISNNIFSNNKFDDDFIKKIKLSIGDITKNETKILNESIGILVMEKAIMDGTECLEKYNKNQNLNNSKSKSQLIKIFLHSMLNALYYINHERLFIYNDIKMSNIVVSKHKKFQLINFGLIQQIKTLEDVVERIGGTPIFFSIKVYHKYTSVLYDWNCVLICLLEILGIKPTYIYDKKNRIYIINYYDIDCNKIIDNIDTIMNNIIKHIYVVLNQENNDFKETLVSLIKFLFYTMNLYNIGHKNVGKLIPFDMYDVYINSNDVYLNILNNEIIKLCSL